MTNVIICADAIEWLNFHRNVGAIITSLPDADEIDLSIRDYRKWFRRVVRLCIEATSTAAPTIFYQTDRKHNGELESKAFAVLDVAREANTRCLWHKIALRRAVGAYDLYRPAYTHMIALSREMKVGSTLPDVIMRGPVFYANTMGLDAANLAIGFAKRATNTIVDPFCGQGTVLLVAHQQNLNYIGIDIDEAQVKSVRERLGTGYNLNLKL